MATVRAESLRPGQISEIVLDRRGDLYGRYRATNHLMAGLRAWREHSHHRGRWATATAFFASVDLALGKWLDRDSVEHRAVRVGIDTADAIVWTRAATSPRAAATRPSALMMVPSAIERGYRVGRSGGPNGPMDLVEGIAPSVAAIAGLAAVRAFRNRSVAVRHLGFGQVGWAMMGLCGGYAFGRRIHNDQQRADALLEAKWTEPRRARHRAAARSTIVSDDAGDSPHSLYRELVVLRSLGSPAATSGLEELERVKEAAAKSLEDQSKSTGGDRLVDVVGPGALRTPEYAWGMLLTKQGASTLRACIKDREVTSVVIADARAILVPGSPTSLILTFASGEEETVRLPKETPLPRFYGDVTPIGLSLGMVWKTLPVLRSRGRMSPIALIPSLYLDLRILGSFRDASMQSWGPREDPGVLDAYQRVRPHYQLIFLSNLLSVISGSVGIREWKDDSGGAVYPAQAAALTWMLLIGRFFGDRERPASIRKSQAMWLSGALALNALGLALSWRRRQPLDLPTLAMDFVAQAQAFLLTYGLEETLAAVSRERIQHLAQDDRELEQRYGDEGRDQARAELLQVIKMLEQAVHEVDLPETLRSDLLNRAGRARQWLREH